MTYGNRSFDNALAELSAILEAKDFNLVAAGAFVANHAFSNILAAGVPMKRTWPTWRAFPDRSYKPFKGKTVLRDLWPSTATPKRPITFPKGRRKAGQILEGRPQDGYGKM